MKKKLIVLSLFDGMSCGRIALERAGIKVKKYYASEIDKYAQIVSAANYPDIIRLGDITQWRKWEIDQPDLIIGGSPCQGFSRAGKGLNFNDPRSKLFFNFVDILKHYKPKHFLLENVKMEKEHKKVITDLLGVKPIEINSTLVSAQNRKRLYWTNVNFLEIKDRKKLLKHILEPRKNVKNINARMKAKKPGTTAYVNAWKNVRTPEQKSRCLTTSGQNISNVGATNVKVKSNYYCLTPLECERLQTVPDNFTAHVSNSQRYKMLGNGWTVDVIAHIFRGLK